MTPGRRAVRRMGVTVLVAVLPSLGAPGALASGTFYVDGANSSCSDTGPGSSAVPYCTISKAAAAHMGPGTTLTVMPAIYREQISVPASGASGSPFVFQAQGSPVVVDGADDFGFASKWTPYSGTVYLAGSVTWSPLQVFAEGARLTASTAAPASLPSKTFRYVSGTGLYVNLGGGNPGDHQALVGHRTYAFTLSGRSWVTIDGFTVTRTEDNGIQLSSSSNSVVISHNTVTFTNKHGISVSGSANDLIASNVVSDNNDHGIYLTSGATGAAIQDNESFRNARPAVRAANGLYLGGSSGNLIQRNRFHDNQDTGENIYSSSNNNISLQNFSWNNGDHGFDHLSSSGNIHIGDVAWHNYKDGFSFEGTAPGGHVFNCIAVENGLTTSEYDLWVDSTSTSGFVSNDNIFWNSTSQSPIKYGSTLYSTIAAFNAATGQDARSIQADPRFASPSGGNFHLLAGSPAIDSADSSVPNWPATDAERNARVDDPGTPNTGLGPVSYADRGALEYLPFGTPPVAALTVFPASGTAPLSVTADASGSYDPDGTVVSYRFDFGDGTAVGPQSGATASHVYPAGSWTATVMVTDNDGMTTSASAPVTVSNPSLPPVAVLAVSPSSGPSRLSVTADASGSYDPDGTVVSYRFDFGDGTVVGPQAGATASHVYLAGNWTAIVTVTDNTGVSATANAAVTVSDPGIPPVASLTEAPSSGTAPLTVSADASASYDPDGAVVSYKFDFGDGTVVGPQAASTATHVYAAGNWTVTATVTDDTSHTGSASASVTVAAPNQPPLAVLSVTPSSGTAPLPVLADGSASSDPDGKIVSYRFDFGDGTIIGPQPAPTATHTFAAGKWRVRLTVTDDRGAIATTSKNVMVKAPHH